MRKVYCKNCEYITFLINSKNKKPYKHKCIHPIKVRSILKENFFEVEYTEEEANPEDRNHHNNCEYYVETATYIIKGVN